MRRVMSGAARRSDGSVRPDARQGHHRARGTVHMMELINHLMKVINFDDDGNCYVYR